jgi:YHS domain-containing protein
MTAAVAGTDGDGACPLENSCGAKCCAKKCPVVKCPVSGVPVSRTVWAKYDGGKVYFGCAGCKAKFEKDPKKYAAKAHQQLVLTGQFEQKACPISGAPVNPEVKIDLGGVSVAFCCGGCRAKLAKAPPEEQVELVFNDATFAKAFAPKKKTPKKQGESKVADSNGT